MAIEPVSESVPGDWEMHPASTTRTPAAVTKPGSAGVSWESIRILFGGIYLLGAAAHVALGLLAPAVYEEFANQALLGVYTDLWQALVVPYLAVLQPLVIVFEVAVGVALLWRGRAVRIGHAAGATFQAGLILSGPWGPINAALALIHLAALRLSYPTTAVEFLRGLVGRRS